MVVGFVASYKFTITHAIPGSAVSWTQLLFISNHTEFPIAGGIPNLASSSSSSLVVASNQVVVPQKSAGVMILFGVESISVWSIAVICATF